jgi:hypothetical protein
MNAMDDVRCGRRGAHVRAVRRELRATDRIARSGSSLCALIGLESSDNGVPVLDSELCTGFWS